MENTHFIDKEPNRYEALAELQKEQIQSMNEEQIIDIVRKFEIYWDLQTQDYRNARELGYRQFIHSDNWDEGNNPLPGKIDILAIKGIRERQRRFLVELKNRIADLKIESKDVNDDGITVWKRVNNVIKQLKDGYENIRRHFISYERVVNPMAVPQVLSSSDPSTMDEDSMEDCIPYQKCLLYTLDEASKCGYRRYKDHCCEEIKTIEGYGTRAWVLKYEIQTFVRNIAPKDDEFLNWKNFTSKGSIYREVIDYISKCIDPQFPEIEKRRNVWSFKNGVFVGKEWIPDRGVYDCRFYPYDSKEFRCLDPTIISCKYFDQQFDDYSHIENWQDIPTPNFDKVLNYQKFDQEVCNWAYVMGGRLCYDIGDLDSWQIIPFFKGIARSGKSTLINSVFKRFYESQDVGVLGNNIERKFGLSALKDSFMFIAPEIKGDLALEQAEFQSIVSGESVSIAVKNKTAVSIDWKVPGVLGGNEIPNWKDNSGSVLRRILPWNFTKQVQEADPNLEKKLEKELPTILLKCIRGYLDYSNKYRDRDIWNVVPPYFKLIQKQVAMVASTLTNFLESTNIEYGTELFVPQKLFVPVFNQHCQSNNLGKHKFHPDFYMGPFSTRDIEVRNESVTYKGRLYPRQPIIYGLDVIEETLAFTDEF
jgi:hypothetical protein|tara:strand:+ start:380 stop:2323 length:1944 start_codon:yes stop_codon:yes gene_type:complete